MIAGVSSEFRSRSRSASVASAGLGACAAPGGDSGSVAQLATAPAAAIITATIIQRARRGRSVNSVRCALFGIAQGGQFAFEALDLGGVLSLDQRVLVLMAGIAQLADFPIGVAQMFGDSGVVARQVDGVLQLVDRFAVIAFLIVDPAEAIDVK